MWNHQCQEGFGFCWYIFGAFTSENKLCFESYQQNLQCKISGRQRKEGNSQNLRAKRLLNLKYLLLRQLKSTSLESVQFHFFRIFEGKKKHKKTGKTHKYCPASCVVKSHLIDLVLGNQWKSHSPWTYRADVTQPQPSCAGWSSPRTFCAGCSGHAAFPQPTHFSKRGWGWSCCLNRALCQQFKY